MMKRLLLGLIALALFAVPSLAQDRTKPGQYFATPPTLVDTQWSSLLTDVNGRQIVSSVGNAASAATDSGNPMKIGCVYNSTTPTVTTGQRVDCQASSRGSIAVQIMNGAAATPTISTSSDAYASGTGIIANAETLVFNGSTWDRAFTCTNTASVNVTAGAGATQVIGLVASQVVRVCSMALSMSAAGTVAFSYGTGTNCGTGTVALTPAMSLATGTPLALTATTGGSIMRTASANALCVTAVTGNVTGFITYAQY